MKTVGVWILNFLIGIIGTMLLISGITGNGAGVTGATTNSASFKFGLDLTGSIIWVVVVLVYFFGAKKVWGKTVGGLILDALMGKKK